MAAKSSRKRDIPLKEVPELVTNTSNGKTYTKGRFLGKGGFARCYELIDTVTKHVYAGKVVAKVLLAKPHQKDKMTQEISIHRSLAHKHVVKFHCFFEDSDNVYILLELCRRRSLMELSKRRKACTEPETRYFIMQVTEACLYLHKNKVIHRDLKLGNLFISEEMDIKIGDFGLATKLDFDGERKKTLCGTPNYIAPEVLGKQGHSYEVDSWSLGCILYTLLVGKPPFETRCLEDTYVKIKKNEYQIPSRVSIAARNLITKLLRAVPSDRPSMEQVMADEFFTSGYLPARLPTSCLQMAPRLDMLMRSDQVSSRKPLSECNNQHGGSNRIQQLVDNGEGKMEQMKIESKANQRPSTALVPDAPRKDGGCEDGPTDYYLSDLYTQLSALVMSKPADKLNPDNIDIEDPASIPIYWVCKWVDYSDKYGIGYQLCDNSFGVLFNDTTRLLLLENGENMQYIERDGTEHYYTNNTFPTHMTKKCTLLKYFRSYMTEHLLKAGANVTPRETDALVRLPFLRAWFRTRSAMVLHLSNGTLQVNFFEDHTKVICCPLMSAVTYIDSNREFRTYPFSAIEKLGCSKELSRRLDYTRGMLERLMNSKSSGKFKAGAQTAMAVNAFANPVAQTNAS